MHIQWQRPSNATRTSAQSLAKTTPRSSCSKPARIVRSDDCFAPLITVPPTTWTRLRIFLNESGGWYPQGEPGRLATRAEIRQVLQALELLRIRAEFVTGDDDIWLDNVRLVPVPALTIHRALDSMACIEWPTNAAEGFQLQSTESLSAPTWAPLPDVMPAENGGVWRVRVRPARTTFYRLQKP